MRSKRTQRYLILAALTGLFGIGASDVLAMVSMPVTPVSHVLGVVGRPATPVSYAGVARRTVRRAN